MLNLALVKRCLDKDYIQGALTDDVFLLVLGPFGFCCGHTVESSFLAWRGLSFWGLWCWSRILLPFLGLASEFC